MVIDLRNHPLSTFLTDEQSVRGVVMALKKQHPNLEGVVICGHQKLMVSQDLFRLWHSLERKYERDIEHDHPIFGDGFMLEGVSIW